MWTCPKCGHQFVNQNQWHSCGRFSEDAFLAGRTAKALDLYEHFMGTFEKLCDFQIHPVKTRVSLLKQMRFASINRLGKDFLDGHLVFHESYLETLCFHKVETISKNQYVHHFRLKHKSDITIELKFYMLKACQETGNRLFKS